MILTMSLLYVFNVSHFNTHIHDLNILLSFISISCFGRTKHFTELNMYGFARVSKGKDRGVITHPCFLRGHRDLCHEITRRDENDIWHSFVENYY